jgi:hypothetical protein
MHLNRITAHELSLNRKDYEEKYLPVVIQMLAADKKFLFAEDILKLYPYRQESHVFIKTQKILNYYKHVGNSYICYPPFAKPLEQTNI